MADPSEYFKSGMEHMKRAYEQETQQGLVDTAFREYLRGIDLLKLGLKYSKNERVIPMYRQKILEGGERAEALKKLMDQGITRTAVSSSRLGGRARFCGATRDDTGRTGCWREGRRCGGRGGRSCCWRRRRRNT